MRLRRAVAIPAILLLLGAGVAAALYLTNRRDVTTSSGQAYEAYREGVQNERRFYFKEARVAFAKALELDPEFAMAMVALSRHMEGEQGKSMLARAERLRDRLSERENLQLELYVARREKGPDGAAEVAQRILKQYPTDYDATQTLAMRELGRGNTEAAIRIFTGLLAVDPNNAEAYNQIGYYHGYRGDYDKAIENLKKYQFMAPNQANPHDSLGEVLAYAGRYDEAITNLNNALAIKPDFWAAYEHLGVAYEGKGEYPNAIKNYTRAAENAVGEEQRFGYLMKVCRVAMISGDRIAGEEAANRIRSLPLPKELMEIVTPILDTVRDLEEKRPAQAERRLAEMRPKLLAMISKRSRSPEHKPYDAGWNYLMALAKMEQGKDGEAVGLFEEMANPPNGWRVFGERLMVYEARAYLAALLAKKGDLDLAEKLLAQNSKWNPSWAPTREAEQQVAEARRQRVLAATK